MSSTFQKLPYKSNETAGGIKNILIKNTIGLDVEYILEGAQDEHPHDNADLHDWEIIEAPKKKGKRCPSATKITVEMRKAVNEVKGEYDAKLAASESQQMVLLKLLDKQEEIEASLRRDLAQQAVENQRLQARLEQEIDQVFLVEAEG